jgi:predicted nucleic acid-binding protein
MRPKIYLETTIASYLSARPSGDLITAAHQQITREWWQTRRTEFDLYVSQIVIQEATGGDENAVQQRLEILKDIPLLSITDKVTGLAAELIKKVPLPPKAQVDALHIAVAVVNGVDYLLTWNCTHIANAVLRNRIENACRSLGYEPPVICTPEELMEE